MSSRAWSFASRGGQAGRSLGATRSRSSSPSGFAGRLWRSTAAQGQGLRDILSYPRRKLLRSQAVGQAQDPRVHPVGSRRLAVELVNLGRAYRKGQVLIEQIEVQARAPARAAELPRPVPF